MVDLVVQLSSDDLMESFIRVFGDVSVDELEYFDVLGDWLVNSVRVNDMCNRFDRW